MSVRSSSHRSADLRNDARLLIEGASDHHGRLEALAALAERDARHAEAAVAQIADLNVNEIRDVLVEQLQRSAARASAAKRLTEGAYEQHAAARQLLVRLGGDDAVGAPLPNAVLVVDDHVDVRDLLSYVLEHAGFVVRTAANGLEALIAAHAMRPRVIVMDVSMPVLDGIEATRLIKAGDATRDARVIAHTSNASFDDSAIRTLFAAIVTKPAPPDAVLAAVQLAAGL